MKRAYRILLISIALLSTAGCDQVTKRVAKVELISAGQVSLLNGVIRLEYAENPGAFLNFGENWPRPILLLVSSLLTAGLILLLLGLSMRKREVRRATLFGLSLIAGGSIGNLIDRVVNGGVVIDFMNVGVGKVRSGIFNMADIAILAGALVLLRLMWKDSSRIEQPKLKS